MCRLAAAMCSFAAAVCSFAAALCGFVRLCAPLLRLCGGFLVITVSHPTFCCVGVGLGCDNSIIDGADKIENMCSIDVTPRISRGITFCSQSV